MNYNVYEKSLNNKKYVVIEKPQNLQLSQIFGCGQAFRFDPVGENVYGGCAFGRYAEFEEKDGDIYINNCDLSEFHEIWKDFFDLDTNYAHIIDSFSHDKHLYKAATYSSGIRILRQQPFETLISFIISQNNNIPRIKKIIENLSMECGEFICEKNNKKYYAFPTAEAICDLGEQKLFELKTGFRAKYIFDAAHKIKNGEIILDKVFSMNTTNAVSYLCNIKGVGPKVAMCSLLFGFSKKDAFPIDVWMKKVLKEHYGESFDLCSFGDNAGVAQQYLFYYERCINNIFA